MSDKILLLGSKGIVGREIFNKIKNSYHVKPYSREDLDITNYSLVEDRIKEIRPSIVINSAAYTNVEKAETDKKRCYEVNSHAVKHLSKICHTFKSSLIHFSTDYIFDGTGDCPYTEKDISKPINIYGDSKNRGDEYIKNSGCNSVIVRTSWVYGHSGNNFVRKILNKALNNHKLEIVSDQFGVPTSSELIANIVDRYLIDYCLQKSNSLHKEVFNLCPSGYTSRFNFARKIIEYASLNNTKYQIDVVPIKSDNYNTSVKRPSFAVLSNQKICTHFDINIQNWEYYLGYFLDSHIK